MIEAIPNTDPLFTDAARFIVENRKVDLFDLSLELEISIRRAGNILRELEEREIIGSYNAETSERRILFSGLEELESHLQTLTL